jgi:hypothetical protein
VSYLDDQIHRSTPALDFHSENIGVFNTLEDPNSLLSKSEIGQKVLKNRLKSF